MATSSTVANGDLATAAQYNDLRADVLTTHDHDGSDGNSALQASSVTPASGNLTLSTAAGADVLIGDDVTLVFVDGGTGSVGLGAVADANSLVSINGTFAAATNATVNGMLRQVGTLQPAVGANAATLLIGGTIDEAVSGTHSIITSLYVDRPAITGGGASTTSATTVYIQRAPTGGATNYSLWVDDGPTQLDGNLTVGGTITGLSLSDYTTSRLSGSTAVSAGTDTTVQIQTVSDTNRHYTYSFRSNDGTSIFTGVHVEGDETVSAQFHSVIGRAASTTNDFLHLINGTAGTETAQYTVLEFD